MSSEISDGRAPESIGPYRLLDQLGDGASSVVYKAYHEEYPTQQVAVKLTKGLWNEADIETRVRFEHEADLLSRLSHDNIIRLHRFGVHGGRLYLVMDLAPGRALSKLVAGREILKIVDIVSVLCQTAEALAHAHGKGILHRDIKPSNLVVAMGNGEARVKVLDFGLSRLQGYGGGSGTVGTFLYMSPEQLGILSQGTDERSDLYSLGMMGVELLNGGHPFAGRTLRELIHSHAAVIPEMAPDTPEGLKAILLGCVKKDPAERYGSARSLAKDLKVLEERLKRGETGEFPLHLGDVGSKLGLPRFVGREKETGVLREMYETARGGKRTVGVLSGVSGVGKTRLLKEAALGWTKSVVLWGQGREYGQATGYGLLAELLRCVKVDTLPEGVAERVRGAVQDRGEDLLRLVPELKPLLNGKMDTTDMAPERRQQRFARVVVDVLQSFGTAEAPLVVVLDDIQWGDEGSLRLIRRFLEDEKTGGVMGVFAFRTEEKDAGEDVRNFVEGVGGWADSRRIELGLLGEKEIEAIVESMLGGPLAEVSRAVAAQAEGNPLYAVEYLRSLTESGAVVGGTKDGWRLMDSLQLGVGREVVKEKIAGRIDQLTEGDRTVLQIAALLGGTFQFQWLARAVGVREKLENDEAAWRVAASLKVAEQARLIESTHTIGRYVFAHNKIRESIVDRMAPELAATLHRAVGTALEQDDRRSERIFELAHHFDRAGDVEKATEYVIQAGDLSEDRYAHRDAVSFYTQAERLMESLPGHPRRAEWGNRIFEHRGDAERMLGFYEEALKSYGRVHVDRFDKKGLVELKTKIGRTLFSKGEYGKAASVLEEALGVEGQSVPRTRVGLAIGFILSAIVQTWHTLFPRKAKPNGDPAVRVRDHLYDAVVHVYYFTNKGKLLYIHLKQLNFAERSGIPALMAQSYCNHGIFCSMIGWPSRGVRYLQRSLAIRQGLGDRWGIAQSRSYLSGVLFPAVRWNEAIAEARLAEPDFEELGDRWELVTLFWSLASACAFTGDWAQSEAYLDRSYRLSAGSKDLSGMAMVMRCRSFMTGRFDPQKGLDESVSLLSSCATAGNFSALCGLLFACGIFLLQLKRYDEAESYFQKALAVKEQHPNARVGHLGIHFYICRSLLLRARTVSETKERRQMLRRARQAYRRGRWDTWPFTPPMMLELERLTLAALLHAEGHFKRAEKIWKSTLVVSTQRGSPVYQAQCLMDWGEAVLKRDRPGALILIRESARICQRLGNRLDLERLSKWVPDLVQPAISSESLSSTVGSSTVHRGVVEAERLETLVETAVQLSGIMNVDDLLQRIVSDAARIFGAERAFLYLKDEATGQPRRRAGFVPASGREGERPVSNTILAEVLAKGKTLISDDAQLDAQINSAESVVSSGVHSFMGVPLKSHGQTLGVLYLDNRLLKGLFSLRDMKILEAFASQAAVALDNAQLFSQQVRTQSDLRHLYDASRELMGVLDRRMIFSSLLGRARTLTGANAVAVALWEENHLAIRLQQGFSPARISEIETYVQTHRIESLMDFSLLDGATVLLVPLWVGDVLEGIVAAEGGLDARARNLLTHLGTQCSLALHNARLYEMAITDELTQVFQRRYYEMVLKNLADRKGLFSLILVDMNDFKVINDTRGHAMGDQVLKAVGRAFRQTLRASDLAARIGGDEFAVVLMGETEETTRQVVEKLRKAIGAIELEDPGKDPPRVWASFGHAMSSEGDLAELTAKADQRLYEDKRRQKASRP